MINYTSPRLYKSNHMIAADLGTRGWSTGGFFFFFLSSFAFLGGGGGSDDNGGGDEAGEKDC